MQSIIHSEAAGQAHAVLLSWLRGLGQDVRPFRGERVRTGDMYIVTEGEPMPAPRATLVIAEDGSRRLERATDGSPARLGYGRDDLVFGHAFAAALLRGTAPAAADPNTLALFALAERVAESDITVLVNGPTGTGKEVLARHIHNHSPRRNGPFIAVNCAALPETMLEALLFGHTKGAFTGAGAAAQGFFRAAHGGTLLLDEIAEMPIGLQAKLLRVLQEREVVPLGATTPEAIDVRVIACANRDLPAEVEAGRFRADLYYRLSVFPLTTLPLCQRRQDIASLAATMILRHAGSRATIPWPTQEALDALQGYDWPGNVRELENVIQRALLLAPGDRIEAGHIVFDATARPMQLAPAAAEPTLGNIVRLHEVQAIQDALAACGGNRTETAKRLGISERTLRYRLARIREAGGNVAPSRSAWA
ncbi:sigma-54-dependent Fis family transcriptional regulator [Sphingomonas sp. ID1715]|uniref:sigma-54 interaction domain-containing protein n=1 Tax=Sphingomonas sp. ID1715 TaxID=1656898 RepID=UPI0014899DDE|nr:sigma-54 dependent transcriptional regulator [Sphingomonas sp. ID1715]NNM76922.1 sigma-54-dependent Fis family transcriptional regulator [Sphingomonas sp. ID1715]